jgi:hypothetical protein
MFGVANFMDLNKLHDSINKLNDTPSDLVHSVNDVYVYYGCTEVTAFADLINSR